MPVIQIMVNRELDPVEGQKILENMSNEIHNRAVSKTPSVLVLHLPGQTRRENPFPDWFCSGIEKSGFCYDDVNLMYARSVSTMREAKQVMTWFDAKFRPFCVLAGGEDFSKKIHLRVMDEHEMLDDKDSF